MTTIYICWQNSKKHLRYFDSEIMCINVWNLQFKTIKHSIKVYDIGVSDLKKYIGSWFYKYFFKGFKSDMLWKRKKKNKME